MNNQAFGKAFLILAVSAFLFFGLANAGALAVDKFLFAEREFGDNTFIGTTDVSNMTESDARLLLSQQLAGWQSNAALEVVYQDAAVQYPVTNAEVLLEDSIQDAQTGEQNELKVGLPEESTSVFLEQYFPAVASNGEAVEEVHSLLEAALSSGKKYVSISGSANAIAPDLVSDAIMPLNAGEAAGDVIAALDGYEIAAQETFSFTDFITNAGLAAVPDGELTQVASALYRLVLQTNFTIEERTIGNQKPEVIPHGFEAVIDRSLDIDFVFTNPNDSSFTLNADRIQDSVYVSLTGYPFVYTYEVQTGIPETVEPRVIKQYSAFVTGGKTVKEEGADGERLDVTKTVSDENEVLTTEFVSTDFYPPQHIIEVYPLETPASSDGAAGGAADGSANGSTDGSGATDGTADGSGTGSGSGSAGGSGTTDGSNGTDGTAGSGGSGTADGSGDNSSGSNADGSTGNGTAGPGSKPVYDKGGNLVVPKK